MPAIKLHQNIRARYLIAAVLLSASFLVAAEQTDPLVEGQNLLTLAVATEKQARDALLEANQIRKSMLKIRQQMAKEKQDAEKLRLQQTLDQSVADSRAAQVRGKELRTKASEIRANAEALLKQGMISRYSEWIGTKGPLVLREQAQVAQRAHNTPVRTTNKKGPQPKPAHNMKKHEDMSLSE